MAFNISKTVLAVSLFLSAWSLSVTLWSQLPVSLQSQPVILPFLPFDLISYTNEQELHPFPSHSCVAKVVIGNSGVSGSGKYK